MLGRLSPKHYPVAEAARGLVERSQDVKSRVVGKIISDSPTLQHPAGVLSFRRSL